MEEVIHRELPHRSNPSHENACSLATLDVGSQDDLSLERDALIGSPPTHLLDGRDESMTSHARLGRMHLKVSPVLVGK